MPFKPVSSRVNFPQLEEEILNRWESNNTFTKSVNQQKGKSRFIFYEGPPTANGKPGSHHVEARVFKDLIPRFKTMRGYYCERKGGWDCHGLPVELEVEKKLGISGKPQIEEYGVEKFCQLCRKSVFEYVEEWERLTERIGFWIDIKNSYATMNNDFIESAWWILKQSFDRGLLYEDYKVVPYCPRCGTSLSSHELALGYKDDVHDLSIYVKFKVRHQENTYLLAWTTTPWTLPGNVALAVHPTATYVEVLYKGQRLILAEKLINLIESPVEIKKHLDGKDLVNMEYEPLYEFVKYDKKAHYVIPADFVSLEEGTGIVHTAVMYGEDDFNIGKKFDLPKKHVVNEKGEFIAEVTAFAGMFVKNADPLIVKDLESRNLLLIQKDITHTYPFCWRCGTPLLYYALTSWYLKTTTVKDQLIANNNSVNWIPAHIKEGRMGEWLNNNRDWALSRSRYWGTPLPIWRCDTCGTERIIGSVKELSEASGKDQSQLDLHRPYIDTVSWECASCPGKMQRLPFVLDCWFDSGSMPFAQLHYPFENKSQLQNYFPADYICEAIDQTRGWFYTLQAVSTLLGYGSPYKNVICLGLALDEKGNKMSKSKGNIVDPWEVINIAGVDAMRWYFYSAVTPGESFRFSVGLVQEVNRRLLLILWNIYSFFTTYANIDSWIPQNTSQTVQNILDIWITGRLYELINSVTDKLDKYNIYGSTSELESFVVDLSTWYIRRSRDRVGPSATDSPDKISFYTTTFFVLTHLCQLLAPFVPFVSDAIYINLTGEESVHLSAWPKGRSLNLKEKEILEQMKVVRKIVELALSQRKSAGIKVRQPLRKISIGSPSLSQTLYFLIKDEVNVKEVEWNKKQELTVSLELDLDSNLISEGQAREIIRSAQELRKALGAKLDQKIHLTAPFPDNPDLVEKIRLRTLADKISLGEKVKIELL
ncbi:hypothetical protein A3H89_03970 [Candidatus Amesbacteria bacterium RIFCSPLOWO2_02_FULL_48_11]|uniref:Isoleucine--tRNA ligase n=5 Tax=Candidatus Amesiibacteriota TaxID=1752730 RepID=A0A1F4ZAX0_9BACT|nr:MAG: Isoleucine-tRNA ligase [Candidatus Amesbacteria bacterium GW2011_GWA2_47_11]KKU95031.1 MAG: Isoleucine-tRNA ligase [Candidatus Amesbacteria bacterium GW2011_GWC1_48_10]KKW00695.1 MAG: Isoleucine-tRNA ligase [Candidatus Amesbacteria bacterium GW2011_GWA1_48_9]OGC90315.1 MAG: hypothetical protein A2V48_04790 [Candidatus Amesbacteria bacterium RBG_19FT_COMBO_48_16]OGC96362.1 MAG: hypothetical protein A3C34_01240 [Candidatus Amesbacteria bacterium RIFCSPHIGHO2_02_FULL_48_21]OGC98595.1 MAG: